MTILFSWIGADGTFWDLTHGPVIIDSKSAQGFGQPKWNRQTLSSAGTDGQRRTAQRARAEAREGYLPVIINAASGADWANISSAWWNSWSPDLPGTLVVSMPNDSIRFIRAYLKDDDAYGPTSDPTLTGVEAAAVTWVADDPFWRGNTVTQVFLQASTADFFNNGTAPPFNLVSGNTISKVVLSNPGDLEAWPTYELHGPASTFSVIINGHEVSGAINVALGGTLQIITDPAYQVALYTDPNGVVTNVTPQLLKVDWGYLPAQDSAVPLSVVVTGNASLAITYEPRYRRAW